MWILVEERFGLLVWFGPIFSVGRVVVLTLVLVKIIVLRGNLLGFLFLVT